MKVINAWNDMRVQYSFNLNLISIPLLVRALHRNVFPPHMAIICHKCNSSLHYHMLMAISHIKSFGPLSLPFTTDGLLRYFCPFLSWKPLFAFKREANSRAMVRRVQWGQDKVGSKHPTVSLATGVPAKPQER